MYQDERVMKLEGNEYDDGEIVSNTEAFEYHDGNVKKHIRTIRNADFDEEVRTWVEREISNITERFHKINDDVISSYFIKACKKLGRPHTIDEILQNMGTTKNKKKILKLTQGTNLKRSPANSSSIIVPYMLTKPVTFVPEIVFNFIDHYEISSEVSNELVNDICHFTEIFCESDDTLTTYIPRSCACAFVYFYLNNFSRYVGKRKFGITQTFFKTMKFGADKSTKMGNTKDFDNCLKKIEEDFTDFWNECEQDEEMLLYLIRHNYMVGNVFQEEDAI